jgi:hypothetical protein
VRHEGKTFKSQTIELDGNEFLNCEFDQCILVYRGGVPPTLDGCGFDSPRFVFEGAASNTMAFLKALSEPASGLSSFLKNSFPKLFGQ